MDLIFYGRICHRIVSAGFAAAGSLAAGVWIRHIFTRDAGRSRRLAATLEKSHLLLRKIHHRVKNNFQSKQSIIRMHQLPAETQRSLFDRIAAMIAFYEQIYSCDQVARVSTRDLIPAVVDTLVGAYAEKVTVNYEIEDISVSADKATPLALLVNEVVTNSLKYAFLMSATVRSLSR